MAISHKHVPFQYSEYISPLPADELIKIGTIKQNLYEEGVEKVQKRIDELDKYGFNLVKDSDKKYFSQEMDKFIKAVNESSAKTDFSNIANVRAILSIGKPIENDPLLLNAIEGSDEYRRRQKVLSSLKPQERSAANDWYFTQDLDQWLNDGKVGTKPQIGKQYVPYVDAAKYVNSMVDKIKPDIEAQIIKDGPFLEKREVEMLTREKLRNWMETSLPKNVVNQIRIDSLHEIKDAEPGQIKNHYFDQTYNQFKSVEETMRLLEGLSTVTAEEQELYKKLSLRKKILYDALQNAPETDEEARELWQEDAFDNFITGQAQTYAYRKEKADIKANPYSLAKYNSDLRLSNMREQQKMKKEYYEYKVQKDKEYGINKGKGEKGPSISEQNRENTRKMVKQKMNNFGAGEEYTSLSGFSKAEAAIAKDAIRKALGAKLKDDLIFDDASVDVEVKKTPSGYVYRVNEDDNLIVTEKQFNDALDETFPAYGNYEADQEAKTPADKAFDKAWQEDQEMKKKYEEDEDEELSEEDINERFSE